MARIFIILLAVAALLFTTTTAHAADPDVVVYGGTAGGTIAAIAAADQGLEVLLLEPGDHIGGMVSGGLGRTDYGNSNVIGGMARDFYLRLGKHYGEDIAWFPEPKVAEQVLRDWLDEAGVTVRFNTRLDSVKTKRGRVVAITAGGETFRAPIFMDATYEGDLMAQAGVAYTVGREGSDVYGESLAGRIAYSPSHQFAAAVSPYDDDGNLLPLIQGADTASPGTGDHKVQAYNFRLCMTQDPENRVPWPKPEGYDPAEWDLFARYLEAVPGLTVGKICNPVLLRNGKTDTNNNGPISTDYLGASWDYPEADYDRRAEIWAEHERYVKSFFYFVANDPRVPPALQAEMQRWGLAKDEFVENDHWPHQLYIREARRMIGDYVMHQVDLQDERTKPDSIGMGSYNSDSHNVQRIVETAPGPWGDTVPLVLNEGDMQVPVKPYEIAYRALTPKRDESENLFVVCCVSASHVAYSSIRMEPQYMIMGQAAGVAAALALKADTAIQDIDIHALQDALRAQRGILSFEDVPAPYASASRLPGIVLDNAKATLTGNWRSSTSVFPFVGYDYIHEVEAASADTAARYTPDLPKTSTYEIRIAYTANPNRASKARVIIHDGTTEHEQILDMRKVPPEQQPFISLGKYTLPKGTSSYLEVRGGTDAGGYVVADAVQWLPVE